jgi:hypothetical protein
MAGIALERSSETANVDPSAPLVSDDISAQNLARKVDANGQVLIRMYKTFLETAREHGTALRDDDRANRERGEGQGAAGMAERLNWFAPGRGRDYR